MVAMDAPRPITPPGWYDDGHGQLRWYDGSQWTQHTAPLARPAAPQAPPSQATAQRAPVRTEDLVQVKRSKLVWILPIVFVVAALVGGLSAVALWNSGSFGSEPLERTYAQFARAAQDRDCNALEQVTTRGFRDDLADDLWNGPFTCEAFASHPRAARPGEPVWGLRVGSDGLLMIEGSGYGDVDDSFDGTTYQTVTLVRQDGRWKLDDLG